MFETFSGKMEISTMIWRKMVSWARSRPWAWSAPTASSSITTLLPSNLIIWELLPLQEEQLLLVTFWNNFRIIIFCLDKNEESDSEQGFNFLKVEFKKLLDEPFQLMIHWLKATTMKNKPPILWKTSSPRLGSMTIGIYLKRKRWTLKVQIEEEPRLTLIFSRNDVERCWFTRAGSAARP